jgi:phosphoribosyl 1,2-cyclic phosphodiesterase
MVGEDVERLDGICLSHSHGDHSGGLPVMMANRKVRARLYASNGSVDMLAAEQFGFGDDGNVERFTAGDGFMVGDIRVQSFPVSHDAPEPCGFVFSADGSRIGVAVDLGVIGEPVVQALDGVDLLMLESNHDRDCLLTGPYPLTVKKRVTSDTGHLSNDAVAAYLEANLRSRTKRLILAHLSGENNHPRLCYLSAAAACTRAGRAPEVVIAEQGKPTAIFEV